MKTGRAVSILLLLAAGCRRAPEEDSPPIQVVLPRWTNQHRRPTSSHLRAVRFVDADTGFVAGEDTSIFRTDDGGQTWVQLEHAPVSLGGDVAAMALFADGTSLHVGAVGADAVSGGRWWTSGDGLNFVTPETASTGFAAMASVELVSPGTAYYLAQDGTIRHVTPSSETSFGVGAAGTWLALAFWGTTGTGYVAGGGGAIRKTSTNGASWTPLTSGTSAALRDLSFVSADAGYACGDGGAVVKTANGTDWTDVSVGLAVILRGVHFADASAGWVVGDGGFIRRTADGGTSWNVPSAVPTSVDLHDVWFVGAAVGYAVGDYGTVIRTQDGGVTWTLVSGGDLVRFNAVDFEGGGVRGIAVGDGGAIRRTVDGGNTWVVSTSGVSVPLLGVSVPDLGSGNVAYVCGAGGTILKTADFGGTWTPMSSGVGTDLRAILFPGGDTYGFCVGDGSAVLHTSTGVSWTSQSAPAADYYAVSAPFTGLTAYAAGTGGRVAYTDMGGTLWYDRSVGAATTLRSLQSPSASTVYAAGEDGKVYRSFLSGQGGTWQAMTPPAAPGGIAFTGPGYGWCVNGGIFTTEDSASTWTRSPEHTRWTLRSVWMNGSGTGYAAGDNGTILRTLTGGR